MSELRKFDVEARKEYTPLGPDEPTFCFRGQDVTFPAVLAHYAEMCTTLGSPPEHVDAIMQFRDEVIAWQEHNGCKTPD
jgi:hypothetical protein